MSEWKMDLNSIILNTNLDNVSKFIFGSLHEKELVNCVFVCKAWRRFLYQSKIWDDRWQRKLSQAMNILRKKRGVTGLGNVTNMIDQGKREDKPLFKNFVMQIDQLSRLPPRSLSPGHIIYSAIKLNQVKLVNTFITYKDDHNLNFRRNRELFMVLHIACNYGHTKMIKLFLETLEQTGLDVNYKALPYANTPLHVLSKKLQGHKNFEALKFMLENSQKFGIDIHAKNMYFRTPFQEMCHEDLIFDGKCILQALDIWMKYPVEFSFSTLQLLRRDSLMFVVNRSYTEVLNCNNSNKSHELLALSYGVPIAEELLKIDLNEKLKNVTKDRLVHIALKIMEEKRIEIIYSDPNFEIVLYGEYKHKMSQKSLEKCKDFGMNNLWFCDICETLFAYEGLFMIHFRDDHQN